MVRLRYGTYPARRGRRVRGQPARDGPSPGRQQVWYGGQTLDARLGLGTLRRRWRAGRAGAPPAAADFTGAETGDIFGYAAEVAADAARRLRAGPARTRPPTSPGPPPTCSTPPRTRPAAPSCARAADGFSRAARAPWGRIPPPSPAGSGLRTAAYLLALPVPAGTRRKIARLALITALAGLARAVADLRQAQQRLLQAAAARHAAAGLTAAAAGPGRGRRPGPARHGGHPWPPAAARPAAPGRAGAGSRPGGRRRRPGRSPGPRRAP